MNKQIQEIAKVIATRKCVLFAGSGLTANSGGATWKQLVDYLKKGRLGTGIDILIRF